MLMEIHADHPIRAGSRAQRRIAGPAVARAHQAQVAEAAIEHGAGRHADIFTQLWLDQDHGGPRDIIGAGLEWLGGICAGHRFRSNP